MVELYVCIGSSCHLKGSYNVIQAFQQMIEEHALHDRVALKSAFCMRACHQSGVRISINGQDYGVSPETARTFFQSAVLPLL